ncbi:DNA (cytosine-5)-methyltransferase 1 [Bradyrhizobium sp. RT9b]|uniref:DNA cytosine methyltransferase n=1 Tax=Bradyrhizobium sp. RT9b TaxID=3156385 RepID=UPI00339092A2
MRAIELFAGAGGLGIGVSRAGFIPAAVVEWNRWCRDTLRENRDRKVQPVSKWPAHIESDIRKVDFSPHEGRVELVSGGPPCQPFSLGGRHRGRLDSRDMWPEAVRVVREVKPKAFIFENVKGLTRESFASYLAYIVHQLTYPELVLRAEEGWIDHLRRLERHHTRQPSQRTGLTYNVVHRVLNAANFGVPQRRERVVFVGFRSDLGVEWSFPSETHGLDALAKSQQTGEYWERHRVPRGQRGSAFTRPIQLSLTEGGKLPWRTVRDAIGDLPDPVREIRKSSLLSNHKFQPGARPYPGHTGSPLDLPAKTLKAGVHGVPGGENMLVNVDGSVRYFTVRESARLQTFPDDFVFHGAWSEAMRQLGNAVPVDLAQVIAQDVRRHLGRTQPRKPL